jgi:cytochrome c oxidase subunit 2
MVIKVIARQWVWQFSYDNGKQSDILRIPVNRPVKLRLNSLDVIHGFYIPAFRIKEDCVPNMGTYLSFTASMPGTYDIFCTEYCGHGHSGMVSKVEVMAAGDFDAWHSAVTDEERKLEIQMGEMFSKHTTVSIAIRRMERRWTVPRSRDCTDPG